MYQPTLRASSQASLKNEGRSRWAADKGGRVAKLEKVSEDPDPGFRILIVDRDSMSSDLLANALVRDGRCSAEAVSSFDLLATVASSSVDLVVISADLNSKLGSGFDLANDLCRMHPQVSVVILLDQASHEGVINAFRSGARGIFSRQQSMADFLDCFEHVRKGFIWAGRQETDYLLDAFKNIPAPYLVTSVDSPALTARELQVVQCAAKGMTNKTIAGELNLSEHTVKNYLFRAFEKLGVSSRVELLFYLTIRGHTFRTTKIAESTEEDPEILEQD